MSVADVCLKDLPTSERDLLSEIIKRHDARAKHDAEYRFLIPPPLPETPMEKPSVFPKYLQHFGAEARVVEFRAVHDGPTDQTTFNYTVEWSDDVHSYEEYREESEKELLVWEKIRDRKQAAKKLEEEQRKSGKGSIPPVLASCDGPCKKKVSSNKLHTMGRCGHYLCETCYGVVENDDGTVGCSSFDCTYRGQNILEALQAYDQEVCSKQRLRAKEMKQRALSGSTTASKKSQKSLKSDSSYQQFSFPKESEYENLIVTDYEQIPSLTPSAITFKEEKGARSAKHLSNVYPGKGEMLIVKVVLIEKNQYNATLRIFNQMETVTSLRVNKALALMLQDKQHSPREYLNSARIYCVLQNKNKKTYQRLTKADLKSARLYDFPLLSDYVFFVVDTVGYVKSENNNIPLYYDD